MTNKVIRLLEQESGIETDRIREILRNPTPFYKRYRIKQGTKSRQIEEPFGDLKELQYAIFPHLLGYPLHKASMSCQGRGTKANAEVHTGARHVLRVDIKGCYQALTKEILDRAWLATPDWRILWEGVDLCLVRHKGKLILPTGAPTSPILCNIALTPLDHQVDRLAELEGYRYTRYLDDLILSTTNPKRRWDLIDEVSDLIEDMGIQTNKKKCRWAQKDVDTLCVTGVTVGEVNSAGRVLRKRLRGRLNNLARAQLPLDQVTSGYLAYIKSIDETAYIKLMNYYQKRRAYVPPKRISPHP